MAFCAVAGFRSNFTASGFGFNAELQATQRRKVSPSKTGVNSARLRLKAMWSSQSARCLDVSAQAPAYGTTKKVSGHHGFNWSICATGPAPDENEPTDEPGDEEPTSDEGTWNNNQASHEVTTNGAPNLFKEELLSIEEFNKRKLRIYEEYITQDNLSDEDYLAEAMDKALAEIDEETVEQANAMKVVAKLEDLYRKTPDAEGMNPDVFDYAFLALLYLIFIITGLAIYMGYLSEPVAQQLHGLFPIIKKEYSDFFYYALKHGRFKM